MIKKLFPIALLSFAVACGDKESDSAAEESVEESAEESVEESAE